MKKYFVLEFNGCTTTIELLDTPIVNKWINVYNSNKSRGTYDLKPETASAFGHLYQCESEVHPIYKYSSNHCVDQLNIAIAAANETVDGAEFPYQGFYGMSWEQTNLIHRCFTLSATTHTNWQHGLTRDELIAYKIAHYDNPLIIKDLIKEQQFVVKDPEKFLESIHKINMWVHRYESFFGNERIKYLYQEVGSYGKYLELDWDNFNQDHTQQGTITDRTSHQELLQSFPDDITEYDVFLGKYIKGKDYEFAFSEYDDPFEYDIANVDGINGSLRVHTQSEHKGIYKDSSYIEWLKQTGLSPELYLPLPVGKIVDTDCDFSTFAPNLDSQERWSNDMVKPHPPFNSVNSYIIQK